MITSPITYRLSRPVTSVDREVVELTLREPTHPIQKMVDWDRKTSRHQFHQRRTGMSAH
jgi:hypothetical protein